MPLTSAQEGTYTFSFGGANEAIWFEINYNTVANQWIVVMRKGSMDLNALWWSNNNATQDGLISLSKSDNSLNMNGSGVTWDGYTKISDTGLSGREHNGSNLLTAGHSYTYSYITTQGLNFETLLAAGTVTLGVRATSVSGNGSIKAVNAGWDSFTPFNRPPTANDDLNAATEAGGDNNETPGGDASGNVLSNDTDADGPSLVVSAVRTGGIENSGTSGMVGSALSGSYGSLTLNANGSYTYVLNNSNPTVDALNSGSTLSESFNYTVSDGSLSDTAVLLITITGANDNATINIVGTPDSVCTEAGGVANASPGDPMASGVLEVIDVDAGEDFFQSPSATSLAGIYGDFTFDAANGAWSYTLNNADSDTQALTAGQSASDSLVVSSFDGTDSETITVSITGVNDNPLILSQPLLSAAGQTVTLTVSDPEPTDTLSLHLATVNLGELANGLSTTMALPPQSTDPVSGLLTVKDSSGGSTLTSTFVGLGTEGADTLQFSTITANATIFGFAGNDILSGGTGSDALYGGSGYTDDPNTTIDTATFTSGTILWNSTDNVWQVSGLEGTDTLYGIERVIIGSMTTWLVDLGTNGGFNDIQTAIDVSSDGDTIRVAPGTYAGMLTIDKEINLLGPNAGINATGAARDAEAILTFPSGSTDEDGTLVYVATDTNNVTIDGFTLRSDDSLVSPTRFDSLIYTERANNLSILNNEMYGSTLAVYVLTANSQTVYRDGLLIKGNHIDGGPNVNSGFHRGMYIQATAGVIKDNLIENANIGIQYMPYAHSSPGLITGNIISAGLIGLYHNYHNKGGAPVTWADNIVTVAPNDRAGLETQVLGAWTTPVTFRGFQAITFGTEGAAGAAAPVVNINGNTVNATLQAGETYNSTILEAVRISTAGVGATLNVQDNTFSGYTLEVNNATANLYTLGTSPDFNSWNGLDALVKAGGTGSDLLLGTNAVDLLLGAAGNDQLTGGSAGDRLSGGAGNDRFIYLSVMDSTAAAKDVITDFKSSGADLIDLKAIFSGIGITPSAITNAVAELSGVSDEFAGNRIAYFTGAGLTQVYVDADSSGTFNPTADLQIQLSGTPSLSAADFLV